MRAFARVIAEIAPTDIPVSSWSERVAPEKRPWPLKSTGVRRGTAKLF